MAEDDDTETDPDSPVIVAHSEDTQDRSDVDSDTDSLFGESTEDQLFTSFESSPTSSTGFASKKRKRPQSVQPSRKAARTILKTKHITLNIKETISPLGSIYGSRDRANRDAGAHFVKLQQELHPDSAMRAPTMENFVIWKGHQDEVKAHCEALNEAEQNFNESIDMKAPDADDHSADDVDMDDEVEGEKTRVVQLKLEVWTKERPFENPRNLLS